MPCFLFTYHAYGSWLPDRSQGFVARGRGILPQDARLGRLYREAMAETAVLFADAVQRALLECLVESASKQRFLMYVAATDRTHLHALVAWRDPRRGTQLRSLIKGSLSRELNRQFERRTWLAEKGSCQQVKNREHFDYLAQCYLPRHAGWQWSRERGLTGPREIPGGQWPSG